MNMQTQLSSVSNWRSGLLALALLSAFVLATSSAMAQGPQRPFDSLAQDIATQGQQAALQVVAPTRDACHWKLGGLVALNDHLDQRRPGQTQLAQSDCSCTIN